MKKKSILILIIIIILILIASVGAIAVVYLSTDILKKPVELFSKYTSQNIQDIKTIINSETYKMLKEVKESEKYESNMMISTTYSEGGEVSNPLNNFSVMIDNQKDENYSYRNVKVMYDNEENLQIECARNDNLYGVRFSDATKSFVALNKNNENLITEEWGVDSNILQTVFGVINNEELLINSFINEEEIQSLTNKYLNDIILNGLSEATYTKQKNALITLNNQTIKTNAYIATLSEKQVENIMIKILNEMKKDNMIIEKLKYIISEEDYIKYIQDRINNFGIDKETSKITISTYEVKGKTVRTTIQDNYQIITLEGDSNKMIISRKILSNQIDGEEILTLNIEKNNNDSLEKYDVKFSDSKGEDSKEIKLEIITEKTNMEDINLNANLKYAEGITKISFELKDDIKMNDIVGEKVELNESNSIILNSLSEGARKKVYNIITTQIVDIEKQKINELVQKLKLEKDLNKILKNEEVEEEHNISSDQTLSQVEVNKFNSQFEFYIGDTISSENVLALLDVVKDNLKSVEIEEKVDENVREQNLRDENYHYNIKLNIQKDNINENEINTVVPKIRTKLKYKVSAHYDNTTGLIDGITINETE